MRAVMHGIMAGHTIPFSVAQAGKRISVQEQVLDELTLITDENLCIGYTRKLMLHTLSEDRGGHHVPR
jgi:hypothetical protein